MLFVSVVLTALLEYLVHKVRSLSGHEEHAENAPRDSRLNKYGPEFVHELEGLCRGHRALIILVDNADMLPDEDRQVLEDLFGLASDGSRLTQFASRRRILIVTVDFGGRDDERS